MKSILFKSFLINPTMAGNKTQTRQVIKEVQGLYPSGWTMENVPQYSFDDKNHKITKVKPKYNVGEIIYVKEKLIRNLYNGISFENGEPIHGTNWVWKRDVLSPLFMPEGCARLFLRITNVRVERIQDISEEDAIKEGVKMVHNSYSGKDDRWLNYIDNTECKTARESFFTLIASIYSKELLHTNPWMFAYGFEKVERP